MIKPFYVAGSFLLLIIFATGVHYALGDRKGTADGINVIVGLMKMSSPSFSAAYYEPRIQGAKKAGNIAYPEMMTLDRMDFVYEK